MKILDVPPESDRPRVGRTQSPGVLGRPIRRALQPGVPGRGSPGDAGCRVGRLGAGVPSGRVPFTHPALDALRSGTDDIHRRLEGDSPLARPDLTTDAYHDVLGRLWGLVVPLEEALECAGVPLVDWPDRRKAPLLAADLPTLDGLARCDERPPLEGGDAVLGCLYVLEGSTLGGRMVAARVESTLGVGAVGTRYFRSYGDQVGARWRGFRNGVAERADAGGDVDVMVASARWTFELFHRWLTP